MNILKTFLPLGFAALVVLGCAAKRADLEDMVSWTDEIVVHGIEYDNKGLPLIGAALAKRPSDPGDRFTVVRLAKGRPVISYDIAVVRQSPDYAKPFRSIYEWTGKGYREGAHSTGALSNAFTEDPSPVQWGGTPILEAMVVVVPVTLGTVGGFMVGLADGIKQTALEMSKVVKNGEQAITCTTYEYDSLGRLFSMRMYTPDRKRELVRTEYTYNDTGTVPAETVVRSLAEDKEREVK
jgi:hypothetical protein